MFCTNCGANIPDGSNVCPNCGFVFNNNSSNNNESNASNPNGANPDMYQSYQSNNENGEGSYVNNGAPAYGGIALALGITGIAGSFIFGIMFGVIAAFIFVVISAAGLVLAINAKKNNAPKAQAAFVCSIIGCAFGFLMMIGCAACGSSCGDAGNYGCYGCVGGACKLKNDADYIVDEFEKEWEKALKDYDWD